MGFVYFVETHKSCISRRIGLISIPLILLLLCIGLLLIHSLCSSSASFFFSSTPYTCLRFLEPLPDSISFSSLLSPIVHLFPDLSPVLPLPLFRLFLLSCRCSVHLQLPF